MIQKYGKSVLCDLKVKGAVELFTKDPQSPAALQNLPYDIDSVLHFSERDYSKNGHRTIMIKTNTGSTNNQNRKGLSRLDLKKIDIVYGPECRARDRQEKIELCQNYPGVARRKREVTVEVVEDTNLRVNRDITPPPTPSVDERIKDLAIEKEMQDAIEQIYKVSAKALTVARGVYCNQSEPNPKVKVANHVQNKPDILNIIATITEYVKSMVDKAVGNMPEFCKASENIEVYQRNHLGKCPFYGGYPCPKNYRSTKSGAVKYSTHHRPAYYQSTKNKGNPYVPKQFVHWRASGNATANSTDKNAERQGSLDEHTITTVKMDKVKDVADARKHKDIGDHTTVYRTKETGIEIDVIHDRKKRDTDDEGKRVEVRNSDELHEKVKALENDGSVHAKDIPKRTSRWEHRRKFQPQRHRPVTGSEDENLESSDNHLRVVELSKKNEEFYGDRKWPNGVVRYIIQDDPNYDTKDVRQRLAEVNAILKKKTCVRLQELSESDVQEGMDYLVVDTSADYVTGRVGGKQIQNNNLTINCLSRCQQPTKQTTLKKISIRSTTLQTERDTQCTTDPNNGKEKDRLHVFKDDEKGWGENN
ncbi:hypothetical protein evm_013016 [Chilo suppressalis]|nr:hypothetical protein evm_013016 [Chilo suppressalis]